MFDDDNDENCFNANRQFKVEVMPLLLFSVMIRWYYHSIEKLYLNSLIVIIESRKHFLYDRSFAKY
jgi:hypothetical protein